MQHTICNMQQSRYYDGFHPCWQLPKSGIWYVPRRNDVGRIVYDFILPGNGRIRCRFPQAKAARLETRRIGQLFVRQCPHGAEAPVLRNTTTASIKFSLRRGFENDGSLPRSFRAGTTAYRAEYCPTNYALSSLLVSSVSSVTNSVSASVSMRSTDNSSSLTASSD